MNDRREEGRDRERKGVCGGSCSRCAQNQRHLPPASRWVTLPLCLRAFHFTDDISLTLTPCSSFFQQNPTKSPYYCSAPIRSPVLRLHLTASQGVNALWPQL